MHFKVMIIVKKLHWCCIPCHLVNKHGVSIDEHLKSCHLDLISLASATSPCPSPDLEVDDFDEGDFELCPESDGMTPKLALLKTTETTQCKRKEAKSLQSKTVNLSKSPADMLDTFESSQHRIMTRASSKMSVKTTENTDSKSGVRTNSTYSISSEKPKPDSWQKVQTSYRRKTQQSLHRSAVDQRQSQKYQDSSTVSGTGEENSPKAEDHLKEPRIQRKRQRLQFTEVPQEEMDNPHTHNDQSKLDDTGISKENFKLPGVKTDKNAETSAGRRTRNDPNCAEKRRESSRKKLKTVDRETKRHCWGGKPVKRSLAISEEETKGFKLRYIGDEQFKNFNGTGASTHSPPAKVNSHEQIAVKNAHTVLDANALKNNTQFITSHQVLVSVTGTTIAAKDRRHTDITEASRTEVSNVDATPPPFARIGRSPSVVPFPSQGNSFCHSVQQSFIDSAVLTESKTVPDIPSITDTSLLAQSVDCEKLCSLGQHPPASNHETPLAAAAVHVLPHVNMSNQQNSDDNFKNIPHTDSVCSQQDMLKTLKTEQGQCYNLENESKSTECEEWVKSTTKFIFSKSKTTASFEPPSKVHECTMCHAKFSTAENLSDHVSKMSTHEPSECRHCQRSFHSTYDLNFHVFEDHERRTQPFCFDCGEKFQSLATFEKHLHQHKCNRDPKLLDMEYHLCNICQTDVPCRYETLRKHYNKHKRTTCLECFVKSELVLLPDATSVREHKTMHFNFCNVCFQNFPSVEAFDEHCPCQSENARQEDGQGKVCGRCSQWCPNKALATLHHKEHKLQVMRTWRVEKWGVGISCVYCDKVLRNKRNLDRHIAQLHSSCRVYNFHCEFCGKGVDSNSILKDHIANHHLGIKRYSCEYCDQRFACAPTLRRHILKEHATYRQYTCEVCGERFCEKFKLTRHMYVHTGSARFMCEQCGKGFHSSSEFKKHTAVHEERRVFPCLQCGLEYKRKEHLKRHEQKCAGSVHSKTQADSGTL